VGCGNSRLGEELLREGVTGGVTCIDLSPVAVQRMRDRLAEQGTSGVDVVVADMLDLPFESESFDLVIEKGTMDVLFVDSGDPWNPNPTTVDNVTKMLEGIHKVLKPGGKFVSITFGQVWEIQLSESLSCPSFAIAFVFQTCFFACPMISSFWVCGYVICALYISTPSVPN
uniref:Methyltransferase domain-containing protein n=1 Tax=Aegilops tauschii subsp. strangulata TaxID=200361 RepID=A0A453B4B2_AEGTS